MDRDAPFGAYGSDADALRQLAQTEGLAAPVHPDLPTVTGAEIVWAARHEQARTAPDALARRTRGLFLDAEASVQSAETVARLLAGELGRDEAWVAEQVEAVGRIAAGEA